MATKIETLQEALDFAKKWGVKVEAGFNHWTVTYPSGEAHWIMGDTSESELVRRIVELTCRMI